MKIFTFRYMWRIGNDQKVNFKIVTDTDEGLSAFEKALLDLENVTLVVKEYLNEFDVEKINQTTILKGDKKNEA